MITKHFRLALLFAGAVAVASGTARASQIVATGGIGADFVHIDTATGAGTTVGPSGYAGTFAAAIDETTGTIYTVVDWSTANNRLATFNTTNGAATPVGGTPFGVDTLLALEVDAAGNLYGGGWGTSNNFFWIDKTTGAAVVIGSTGFDFVMDFAFNKAGTLWAVDGSNLWTIDTTTGVGTFVAAISGTNSQVMGIMFDTDGTLYATDYIDNSSLYRLDTTTGAATLVGSTGLFFAHGGDIALGGAVPEPASVVSAGIAGLLGVVVAVRRRKASAA